MRFLDIPEPIDEDISRFSTPESVRQRSLWFIRLRWMAVVTAFFSATIAKLVILEFDLLSIYLSIGILALVNLVYLLYYGRNLVGSIQRESFIVKIQMFTDLLLLTVMIHYSGGIENPQIFLYFFHVIIASLMFKGRQVYLIAGFAILLFTGEVILSSEALVYGRLKILENHYLFRDPAEPFVWQYVLFVLASFWFAILVVAFVASSMMERYRRVRDKLVHKQLQLIDTDKEKMQFFRFVTHELKSPIVTIQSAIDTVLSLTHDCMDERCRELLVRSRDRSQQLIDMVKDLSEITQGTMPKSMEPQKINIAEMIQMVASAELSGNPKNIDLQLDLPSGGFESETYPNLLEKVLINLVSNAIRYSHDNGQVRVSLKIHGASYIITVADQGIGIRIEDQQKIFSEFYRSPEAKQFTKIGTGLGMSIVQRFVKKLNGEITVDSEINKGSTFKVELPAHVG